jgi:hypothetical protein
MQLVELLEIPQLVDACSRNGFYDEAMELAIFVNSLERKHVLASEVRVGSSSSKTGGGYGVVQGIVDDVHVTLVDLRRQLLIQLSEESSLPKLLQILGVLRKLDSVLIDRQLEGEKHSSFSSVLSSDKSFGVIRENLMKRIETTLQMNFLEARSVWMERTIRDVLLGRSSRGRASHGVSDREVSNTSTSAGNTVLGPYGRGIELLEACRSSWFSVVTQYNALFAESVGEYSSKSLLSCWLENQLQGFEVELKELLVKIDEGPSVRSLIEQCYSFSDRMSQVGCDFSNRIDLIFEDVVFSRIGNTWRSCLSSFKHMVEMEKCMVEVEDGLVEQMMPLYLQQDSGNGNEESSATSSQTSLSSALMSYPPLAYLMNSFLTGMNFLRDCPLLSLRDALLTLIEDIFRDLCHFLVMSSDGIRRKGHKFANNESTSYQEVGTHSDERMDQVYALKLIDEVIPYSLECFRLIFNACDGGGDFQRKSDAQFVENTKDIEIICRDILANGGLVLTITTSSSALSANMDSTTHLSKKSSEYSGSEN